MLDDNEMSLTLTKDPKSQNLKKHIDVMYYHIRRLIENEEISIKWISSFNMLANSLTKIFPTRSFKKHEEKWDPLT